MRRGALPLTILVLVMGVGIPVLLLVAGLAKAVILALLALFVLGILVGTLGRVGGRQAGPAG